MDLSLSDQDEAFRIEVRDFLAANLPDHLRQGAERTPGVFVDPDIGLEWQRILNAKGWAAPLWPKDDGGPGWTPMQRYIFDKECALASSPSLSVLSLKLVGPVICRFGTPEQKTRFLPRILSGEDYWCQGYSEPGSGSDLAHQRLQAVDHPRPLRQLDLLPGAHRSGRAAASRHHLPARADGSARGHRLAGDHPGRRSRGQRGVLRQRRHRRGEPNRRRGPRLDYRQIPAGE
jgi:hypothetical protein